MEALFSFTNGYLWRMKHAYKVEFLSSPRIKGKSTNGIDGVEFAKDLEALILEYFIKGYELFETKNINSHYVGLGTADTTGLLVIFKLKE